MKKQILYLLFSFVSTFIFAQNTTDLLRYSLLSQGSGTGRTMGIAGAGGALGADFSVVGTNPAGLASFRTSEFVFTPGYFNSTVVSKLVGDKNVADRERSSKFNLNNIGFVSCRRPEYGNWTTKNFALGYNRIANFSNSYFYEGQANGSIINRFQENATFKRSKGIALDGFEEGLADEANAIYLNGSNAKLYSSDFDGTAKNASIYHSQEGFVKGNIGELTASYAANYKEKILIGATIAFPFVNYTENKTYQESDDESLDGKKTGNVPYFKSLIFKENLVQSGAGVNAKIGVIFKVSQSLRLGAAAHTPTVLSLTDNFTTEFTYNYIDNKGEATNQANSPDGVSSYTIRTPWKVSGNAAYLFGKKGFISADIDFVDYTQMNIQIDKDKAYQNKLNQSILSSYQPTVNVRVGAEYAKDIFRFRAGIATLGLPQKGFDDRSYFANATKMYTLGAGIRENNFYADLGYQVAQSNYTDKPYLVSADFAQPVVNKSRTNSQFVVTFGFKF
jgi:hypothetical protein